MNAIEAPLEVHNDIKKSTIPERLDCKMRQLGYAIAFSERARLTLCNVTRL